MILCLKQAYVFFFYVAPLIGLLLGVAYLKKEKRKELELTVSKVRLEENIESLIYKLDPKKCVNRYQLERDIKKMIQRLESDKP